MRRRASSRSSAALALSACGKRHAAAVSRGGRGADRRAGAGAGGRRGAGRPYFTVPADQLPHLKIAPVRKTTWSAEVRTTGTVDWDNDHTTQAITQVSGPIARIVADTGTRVKAGDPLLYVASAGHHQRDLDLSQSEEPVRSRAAHRSIATRICSITRRSSPRDFEAAQADYNDASTDLQASLQTLKVYGVASRTSPRPSSRTCRSGRSW